MDPGVNKAERALGEIIFEYLDNRALWPVFIALLGHFAIILAPLLRSAWVDHSLKSVAVLFLAVVASAAATSFERRVRGRLGWLSVSVGLTWAVGAAVAYFTLEIPFI